MTTALKSRNFNNSHRPKIQKKSECDITLPLSLLTDVMCERYRKKGVTSF